MKSIMVTYQEDTDIIAAHETATVEEWTDVCERFDNDVRKVKSVDHHPDGYTALYLCFDADNAPCYYLVEEDAKLKRMRRKVFLSKLGMETV